MKLEVQIITSNYNQETTLLVPVRRARHKVFVTTAMIEPQVTANDVFFTPTRTACYKVVVATFQEEPQTTGFGSKDLQQEDMSASI